ncbi:histidine kinase [Xylanimonas sp. McL0601]|uniref:sensor histidine kinase n=1 Tax=Xylanimonas sp. McL0601 TaxID=3414739 RepID=UPI003CEBC690
MTSADDVAHAVAPALRRGPELLRAPFSLATVRAASQLALGWVWFLSAGQVLWIFVVVSAGLVPALGIGLPLLALSLAGARLYGTSERARLAAQTGVRIAEPSPAWNRRPRSLAESWAWMWAEIRNGRSWAATAYAFVGLFVSTVFVALVTALAAGAVAAVVWLFVGRQSVVAEWLGAPWPMTVAIGVVVAVLLLWGAAVLAQYGSLLVVRLAQALLGPSSADVARLRAQAAEQQAQLAERQALAAAREAAVAEQAATTARERAVVLTETRAQAVHAADAERRRIERDLHDGAQQRLVALGVELGVARRLAEQDPAAAAAALEHAHGEVKETLAELRDLVRGIHPAVLSDRGLDAALSALAARSPVPVRVHVDGDLAPASPAAQAAAYFVVAEALTNVAKHAQAASALVCARLVEDDGSCRLRVVVSDDGRGGAHTDPGSGLAGLRGRVAALDGTFELESPAGAGTRLTVEVPCAS